MPGSGVSLTSTSRTEPVDETGVGRATGAVAAGSRRGAGAAEIDQVCDSRLLTSPLSLAHHLRWP
jgi:hypothetical protein